MHIDDTALQATFVFSSYGSETNSVSDSGFVWIVFSQKSIITQYQLLSTGISISLSHVLPWITCFLFFFYFRGIYRIIVISILERGISSVASSSASRPVFCIL